MQLQDYFAAERKRFPATADIAYFMTASTGLIPDYVHEGISAYQEARYRRGGDSRWRDGEDSMAMMYRSKCQMADMLGCGPEDIAFAANTTQALSYFTGNLSITPGDNVVIPDNLFETGRYLWQVRKADGLEIRRAKTKNGVLAPEALTQLVDERTVAVFCDYVESDTGFRLDAATVGKFCRERGVPFILDAAQAAGALPLNVQDLYVDMLAGNDYKWMLNYCGTGFVYIRKELRQSIQQKSAGWMSADDVSSADDLVLRQDAGRFELGFPNVSGIYGLGLVAERYCALGAQTIERYLAELRSYLCQQVELTSGRRLRYHFRQENQSQIVCLLADSTLHITDQQLWHRRAVCDLKGSDPQTGELILRVALHYYNTKEDIDRLILAIQGCRQGA